MGAILIKSENALDESVAANFKKIHMDYGMISATLVGYLDDLKSTGYTVSQAELSALKNLDEGLVDSGYWGNILEIWPMIGNSLNPKTMKLKWKTSKALIPINSFDNSNIDSKGLVWNTVQGGGAKALRTGLKMSDLLAQEGLTLFISSKINTSVENSNAQGYYLGAGTINTIGADTISAFMVPGNGNVGLKVMNGGLQSTEDYRNNANLFIMKYDWTTGADGVKTISKRQIFNNGIKDFESLSQVALSSTTIPNSELYLGASNVSEAAYYTLANQMPFLMISDGKIPDEGLISINTLINNFLLESGKAL